MMIESDPATRLDRPDLAKWLRPSRPAQAFVAAHDALQRIAQARQLTQTAP